MKWAQLFLKGAKGPEAIAHPDFQLTLDPKQTIKQQRSYAHRVCLERDCIGFQIMWGKVAITPYWEVER